MAKSIGPAKHMPRLDKPFRYALVILTLLTLIGCDRRPSSHELGRFGVCAEWDEALPDYLDQLGDVWYYDYHYRPPNAGDHPRLFMVRWEDQGDALAQVLRENRGAWWAVGNEPNDPNQDDRTPEEYAVFYHDFWHWAKGIDKGCRITPAGIADADWRWADDFREAYRAAYGDYPPVDGWNIHNYLLETTISPYNVDEFKRRILAFRHWMMQIGEDDKPLFLTEFGVLYGTGCCERPVDPPELTIAFMHETVTWLATTDHVQYWAWFIANNAREFNGGLFDENGQITAYGEMYRQLLDKYGN